MRQASAVSDNRTVLNDSQLLSYQTIQANTSNFFGSINEAFSVPNFLYGEPLFKAKNAGSDYEQTINNFFQTYPGLFQTKIGDFRIEVEKPKDRNITQVHLFQKYQSIPVFGAELIFTFNDKNELISYLGKYVPHINVSAKPKISPTVVQNIVARDLSIDSIKQKPKLFIFNVGVLTDRQESTQLVWRLPTNGWVYFVDANTKALVYKYKDSDNALDREVYSGGGGTPTLPGTLVVDEGNTAVITDDDAEDAYNYSEDVYSYFYNNFGLNSYNDDGTTMVSTVDYDTSSGARWCNYLKIQDVADCPAFQGVLFYDGYTVLDITAHEWTHAVDDYAVRDEASELYGLTMSEQSGALNESYSDIFGVLIEAEYGSGLDWDIGEDSPIGTIRNLADPTTSASPQPDDWSGYDGVESSHYNSGIPNKAAYLIMREPSEGVETFNSTDVTGIGLEKAENIFYYALRDELITSATFDDNFNALLQTCLTLEVITIDTADCESIFDAYTAIGINTDSSYIEAAVTASTETGYAPLTVDFDGSDSFALNATITDYVWDFDTAVDSDGDGDSTNDSDNTGPVASYTYTIETNTHARLTVTDDTLNSTYTSVAITVGDPIEPAFTVSGDHSTAPATVSFDASGTIDQTGTITDYTWDFGDGTTTSTGTTSTTTHTYNPGNYTATLVITDSNGYTGTVTEALTMYAGGNITSDTTWSADYDPYIVNGDLTIDSGYTLTIEPGVVIKFYDSTSYLTVNGTLNAQGTVTDGIVFTSYQDDDNGGDTNGDGTTTTPAAGDWQQIDFASGSIATLDYVTIQYGGQSSSYPMVNIESDNVTISNGTIANGGSYNVYISSASPNISTTTITAADYHGVYIDNASPTLDSNTISDNFYYGIYVQGSSSAASITDNSINDNGFAGVSIDDGSSSLDGNIMNNNTYYGAYISNGSSILTSNVISNHAYAGLLILDGSSVLSSNTMDNNWTGVSIHDGSSNLNENTISNNSGYGVLISGGSSTLDGNTMSNNPYGILTTGGAMSTLTNNRIYDNTDYGLINLDFTITITAENNWWGDASGPLANSNPTGTGNQVSNYVDFDPWLTADPTADITPPSDVTLGTTRKDVWAQTITLNWTNPTDSDFDHVQIDRTDVTAGTTTTLSSSETGTSYSDTTPSYNTIYTYTLYTVDTTGNVSTGVTTSNQRLRNPAPTNLTLTAGDTTIAATWNASSAPASTIGGYIVYYGTSRTALTNSIDVGNVTNTTLTGLTNYTRYFVAVAAYSKGGHESAQSGIRATRPHP